MPKYLSGRAKLVPQDALSADRYRYLALDQAEPNPSNPSTLGIADGDNSPAIPAGTRYQLVTVHGDTSGSRYWIPVGGGIIPGSISVYDDGVLVGSANSITQLDFEGNVVTASALALNPKATLTFKPPGNDSNVLFKESDDFATSSKLLFNSGAGILTSTSLNIGLGGTNFSAVGVGSSGMIGIGREIPSQNVDIKGNLRITGTIFDGDNNGGSLGDLLVNAGGSSLEWKSPANVQAGAGGKISEIQYHDDTGLVDGAPNFVWVESTQRVGIGSTQPNSLLDVVGIASFTNLQVSGVTTTYGRLSAIGLVTAYSGIRLPSLTENRIPYVGTGKTLADSSNLQYDGESVLTLLNANITGVTTLGSVRIESNTIDTDSGNLILDSASGTVQSQDIVFINNDTGSISTDSGALQVNGGVGINENLNVGGAVSFAGPAVGVAVTLASSGGITTTGGDLYVGGDLFVKDDLFLEEGNFQRLFVNPGIATFKGDIQLHGVSGVTSAYWDKDNNSFQFIDDTKAKFGTGGDLSIYYTEGDGSNGGSVFKHTGDHDMRFQVPSGNHDIVFETTSGDNLAVYNANAGIELHWRGSSNPGKKFETTASGVTLDGGLYVNAGVGTFTDDVKFTGAAYDLVWDKSENALAFADETKVTFGSKTNGDLQISHTNDLASQTDSNGDTITDGDYASYINERGEGPLVFKTNGGPGAGAYQFFDTAWRPLLKLYSGTNARAALYHAATERLVTTEQGIEVTGLNVSGVSTFLGEFHDKDGDVGGDGDFLTATSGGLAVWRNETELTIENARNVGIGSTTETKVYYPTFVEEIHLPNNRETEPLFVDVGLTYSYDATTKVGTVGIGTSAPREVLDVVGTTTTGQLIVAGVSTFAGITTVIGNTLFTKQLSVSGVSTLNNDTFVEGTTDTNQLKVSGVSTFTGIGTFGNELYVGTDLYVKEDLTVGGITTTKDLWVAGVSTFVGFSSFIGISSFTDDVSLNKGLKDHLGNFGSDGNLLESRGNKIKWVSADDITIENANKVGVGSTSLGINFITSVNDDNAHNDRQNEYIHSSTNFVYDPRYGGKVGIGTTAPSDTLSVSGISSFNGDVYLNGINGDDVGITSLTWKQSTGQLEFKDDVKAVFGTDSDLSIYHNGTNSYIHETGTGALIFKSDTHSFRNSADTEQIAMFNEDGAVELYCNGSKTFETTGVGVSIYGGLQDKDGDLGELGQILSSTGTEINWIPLSDASVENANLIKTLGITTDATFHLTFVDDNNTTGGAYEAVYTGAGITVNASNDYLYLGGSLYLDGTGASTDGDIHSWGGSDGEFGIFNEGAGPLWLSVKDSDNTTVVGIVSFSSESGNDTAARQSIFQSNLYPRDTDTYNIGTSTGLRWNHLHAKKGFLHTLSVSGITTTLNLEVVGVSTFVGVSSFIGISSFTSDVSINAGLKDWTGDAGDNLQILQSTGSQVVWVDPDAVTIGQATQIRTDPQTTDSDYYITFVDSNDGATYKSVYTSAGIKYNPNFYGDGGSSKLTIDGDVGIAGTLTYEDVTNVDSIGIVTAGKGLRVTTAGIIVTAGVSTFGGALDINNNVDVSGISTFAGITTVSGTTLFAKDVSISGVTTHSDNVLPSVTDQYDLGSTTQRWNNIYAKNIESGGGTDPIETVVTKSGNFNGTDQVIDADVDSSVEIIEYTIFFSLNSAATTIQSEKVLIMSNGTTPYIQEYAIMFNNTRIANLSTDINGGNTRLLGTSTEQVNYKLVRRSMT